MGNPVEVNYSVKKKKETKKRATEDESEAKQHVAEVTETLLSRRRSSLLELRMHE